MSRAPMESRDEGSDVRKFYAREAERDGGVGYRAKISQVSRFMAVLKEFPGIRGGRVLDVGCGTGDFAEWLSATGRCPELYRGIDITPEVIEIAERRYEHSRVTEPEIGGWGHCMFECVDVDDVDIEPVERPDYVVAITAFMVKERTVENSQRIFRNVLNRMWDLATVGVAVDFLSPRAKRIDDNVAPVPEMMAFEWGKALTDRVKLDFSYAPHAYTLFLLKGKSEFQRQWDESGGWRSA